MKNLLAFSKFYAAHLPVWAILSRAVPSQRHERPLLVDLARDVRLDELGGRARGQADVLAADTHLPRHHPLEGVARVTLPEAVGRVALHSLVQILARLRALVVIHR